MESSNLQSCPQCGRPFPGAASAGLCPRCLMRRALVPSDRSTVDVVPVAKPDLPRRFGDYELVELIARGGMGVVYAARQPGLDRIIAVKLLLSGAWASPEYVERFRTEARAAAALDHPNIVPVYGFGECEGHWYLAMKRIEGGSLADSLRHWGKADGAKDPSSLETAVELVVRLAHAVHYAHQRGVLHRDLKPGNVLLDHAGQPHLTDFGLARLDDDDVRLTRTRGMLGTPAYMAPEQAGAGNGTVTTATDVYALGAILYELIAGDPPFSGPDTPGVLRAVAEQDPEDPWQRRTRRRQQSSISRPARREHDLCRICLKCLEKDPARRYGSAEALALDLARWQRGEAPEVRPPTWGERMRKWARKNPAHAAATAVAIAGVVAVTSVSAYLNVRLTAARRTIAAQSEMQRRDLVRLNVATGTRLAEEGDPFAALLWFAEAARLDESRPERAGIHALRFELTRSLAPGLDAMVALTSKVTCATFDPATNRVAVASRDGWVRLLDPSNDTPVLAIKVASPAAAVGFSPDGARLITRGTDGTIETWSIPDGSRLGEPLKGSAPLRGRDGLATAVAHDPTGGRMATLGRKGVQLRSSANGQPEGKALVATNAWHAAFSPDGTRLAVASAERTVGIWSVEDGTRLASGPAGLGWRSVAWSPDGRRIVATDVAFGARVFSAEDGRPESSPIIAGDMIFSGEFSPDSGRLLLIGYDNAARVLDGPDWKPPGRVLRHKGPVRTAAWSPDGRQVVTGSQDGTVRVWDAASGEPLPGIIRHGGPVVRVEFRADGRGLLTVGAEGLVRWWHRPRGSAALREFNHGSPLDAVAFSPDGQHLLSVGLDPGLRLWDMDHPDAPQRIMAHPRRAFLASFAAGGGQVVSLGSDEVIRWWDAKTGSLLREKPQAGGTGNWEYARFSRDATRILLVHRKGPAELRDGTDGSLLGTLDGTGPGVGLVESSTDGTRWVASDGRQVRFWDLMTGRPLEESMSLGDASGSWVHAISPDGGRIASYGEGFEARITDRRGAAVGPPLRHVSRLSDVVFSPDGRVVATSSHDGTVRLWEAETGDPLGPPLIHPTRVLNFCFSTDGTRLATASSDGVARVWAVDGGKLAAEAMQDEARRLAGHELDPLGGLRELPVSGLRWRR